MSKNYIDYKLIEQYPNKHNLKPKDIHKLVILDWEKLKQHTWKNNAMNNGTWYCHLEGSNGGGFYGDNEDEFWIGFREEDNKIRHHFTSREGMCSYKFTSFYSARSIENKYDMQVQANTIKYLNMLIDEGILALKLKENDNE